ncbi:hypothetical protein BHM03_00057659, partial [Ensete ventricosum]
MLLASYPWSGSEIPPCRAETYAFSSAPSPSCVAESDRRPTQPVRVEAFEASLAGETSTSRATVRVEEALPPDTLGIPCNSPRSIRSTSQLKGEILHHLRHSSMSGCRGNRRLASRASTEIHMPGSSELSLKTLASTSDGGPEDAPEEPTLGSPRLAPPDPGEEMTL